MNKKRIFLACLDERLRIALLLLLEDVPGMVVVGFTDRLQSLIPQLEASEADVLVLEWHLAPQELKDLLDRIHSLSCHPKIIYFSGSLKRLEEIQATGADYVILKNAPPDDLIPILNQIESHSTIA